MKCQFEQLADKKVVDIKNPNEILKLMKQHFSCDQMRGGFNLEYGYLENGYLEGIITSKVGATDITKKCDGLNPVCCDTKRLGTFKSV